MVPVEVSVWRGTPEKTGRWFRTIDALQKRCLTKKRVDYARNPGFAG